MLAGASNWCLELGVAQSRVPVFPKPTHPASLRDGAPYSVPSQRPMGKHWAAPFVPSRRPPQRAAVGWALGGSAKREAPQVADQRDGAGDRERAGAPSAADIFVDRRSVGSRRAWDFSPAGPSRAGSGVESSPPTRRRSFSADLSRSPDLAALPRHFTETTARPFLPHLRHRSRPLRSRTLAAALSPALSSASGVSSAT